ncbi:hypothetical protein LCGC14_0971370, partial [marine sediment metagenome]
RYSKQGYLFTFLLSMRDIRLPMSLPLTISSSTLYLFSEVFLSEYPKEGQWIISLLSTFSSCVAIVVKSVFWSGHLILKELCQQLQNIVHGVGRFTRVRLSGMKRAKKYSPKNTCGRLNISQEIKEGGKNGTR